MKTIKELEELNRGNGDYNARISALKDVLGLIDERIKDYKFKLKKIKSYSSYYEGHRRMLTNKIMELEELKAKIKG